MFKNFLVVLLSVLTAFILLLTVYLTRSGLSLRLVLFSAGDILYVKNIFPVAAPAIPPFVCLTGLLVYAGRKRSVFVVSAFLLSLLGFALHTDFATVFLPGTLRDDKEFLARERQQAGRSVKRLIKQYVSLPQSDILRRNCVKNMPAFSKAGKNVVFIMLESMEYNFSGYKGTNLIPNIEELQKQHLSFSGRTALPQLANTAAATAAFVYGLPIEMHDFLWAVKDYNYDYLRAYPSIVDVYNRAGYQTAFIFGCDKDFAKTENFIKNAGFKEYLDKTEIIRRYRQDCPLNDWGVSDYDLYAVIKDKILEYHRRGQPFFILAKTVETHFPQGYPSPFCPRKSSDMETAVFCADKMLRAFLDWAEKQSFYRNTLFVIAGDHLMMSCPFADNLDGERDCVFTVINGGAGGHVRKPHSAFDLAPTILELSGARTYEHRFGLGTSLLADKPTLAERLGVQRLKKELDKRFFR